MLFLESILVILVTSLSSQLVSSAGVLGYQCNTTSPTITALSLVSVNSCELETSGSLANKNRTAQVIQLRKSQRTVIGRCQVTVTYSLWSCKTGMFSANSAMEQKVTIQRPLLSKRDCSKLVENSYMKVQGVGVDMSDQSLSGLGKKFLQSSVLIYGSKEQGNCRGTKFIFESQQYDEHLLEARIEALIEKVEGFYVDNSKIDVKGRFACETTEGYCSDVEYGTLYVDISGGCSPSRDLITVYSGVVTVTTDSRSKNGSEILIVDSGNFAMAIYLKKETDTVCGYSVWKTSSQGVFIHFYDTGLAPIATSPDVAGKVDVDMTTYTLSLTAFSRFDYTERIGHIARSFLNTTCHQERKLLFDHLSLAKIRPELLSEDITGVKKGFVAIRRGDVMYMTSCLPVVVLLRNAPVCYEDVPVRYNDSEYFLHKDSRILITTSTQVECSPLTPMMFLLDGDWFSFSPHVMMAKAPQVLSPRVEFSYNPGSIEHLDASMYDSSIIRQFWEDIQVPINIRSTARTLSRQLLNRPVETRIDFDRLLTTVDDLNIWRSMKDKALSVFVWVRDRILDGLAILVLARIICIIINYISKYRILGDHEGRYPRFIEACFTGLVLHRMNAAREQNTSNHRAETAMTVTALSARQESATAPPEGTRTFVDGKGFVYPPLT